ncbi:MAG TPA: glutamate racemase [Sphingomonas sp.]|nr:glutamate racemase [Sphingomonas sp.]
MADERPILVFDSGVGGLSVLDAARALLPEAAWVYVADSAGFPYGTKTEREIDARVPALLGRLAERYRPRLIVIACNTASTIALASVRAALDLPIVGTVPAIKPAAALSETRVIGVLGTEATVRQPYVDDLAARFAADCTVLRHGSAALVELAEAKLRGLVIDPAEMRAALAGLFDQPGGDAIDVVVNACTHFPLLVPELEAAAPHRVRFIDGSAGIARRIVALTRGQEWPASRTGIAVFTGHDSSVEPLVPALAARGLDAIESL